MDSSASSAAAEVEQALAVRADLQVPGCCHECLQEANHASQERADALQRLAAAQLAETLATQQVERLQQQVASLEGALKEAACRVDVAQDTVAPAADAAVTAELDAMRCADAVA